MLLPSDTHPFDQFLVKAIIEVPNYEYFAEQKKIDVRNTRPEI